MRIIDRYIIKIFLTFLFLALLSLVLLYDLINFFDNLRIFLSRKMTFVQILKYYLYFTPSAISLLYPGSMVIAAFITYGSLSQNNQLIIIRACGINLNRIFIPLFTAGVFLSILFALFNEFVTTEANFRRRNMIGRVHREIINNFFYIDRSGWVLFGSRYKEGSLSSFFMIKRDKSHKVIERIDGERANWENGKWVGKGIIKRHFEKDSLVRTEFYDRLTLPLLSMPQDFERGGKKIEEMKIPELNKYIRDKREAGWNVIPEKVELYMRWTFHLIGIILILVSFPIGTGLVRTGRIMGIGIGMLLSFFYWGTLEIFRSFALGRAISPFMGALIPHLIFFSMGIVLFYNTKR